MDRLWGGVFLFLFALALFGLPVDYASIVYMASLVGFSYFAALRAGIIRKSSYLNYKAVLYLFWLINEIRKSAFFVIGIVWRRKISIEPSFAWIDLKKPSLDLSSIIYANSITLTPGTITADIAKGRLFIHALDRSLIEDLKKSDMELRSRKIISGNFSYNAKKS